MAAAQIFGQALVGIKANTIEVETTISNGLPQLAIVGLREKELDRCGNVFARLSSNPVLCAQIIGLL